MSALSHLIRRCARRPLAALALLFASFALAPACFGIDVTLTLQGSRSHSGTQAISDSTDELIAEIRTQTGLDFPGPLSLVVCSDESSFAAYSQSYGAAGMSEVLGFFAPSGNSRSAPTIALNLERIDQIGTRARGVYKHELLHAALHASVPVTARPLWFEEGLAQYVSEAPMESVLRQTGQASGSGRDPLSLDDVSQMLRTPEEMGFGYAHALAAINLLVKQNGDDGLRRLIAELRQAANYGTRMRLEEAYQRTFVSTFAEFDSAFVAKRARTTVWSAVLWVCANLWPLLMAIAAALLLVAIRRRRRKHRAMLANWREADEAFPADPAWTQAQRPEGKEGSIEEALAEHGDLYEDDGEAAMEEHRRSFRDDDEPDYHPGRR
jgi:hypothetical protein